MKWYGDWRGMEVGIRDDDEIIDNGDVIDDSKIRNDDDVIYECDMDMI